jgi:hypothetical protein
MVPCFMAFPLPRVKVYGILQRKINTGSHGHGVTHDSGRNGKGNGITLWSRRSKFVGSMDQLFCRKHGSIF